MGRGKSGRKENIQPGVCGRSDFVGRKRGGDEESNRKTGGIFGQEKARIECGKDQNFQEKRGKKNKKDMEMEREGNRGGSKI